MAEYTWKCLNLNFLFAKTLQTMGKSRKKVAGGIRVN